MGYEQRLYTVPDVLASIRVSRTALYRLIKAGNIRLVKVGRRSYVTKGELDRWLRTLETQRTCDRDQDSARRQVAE